MTYDQKYYESIRDGCQRSARKIVPLIIEAYSPKSVVDVGCGEGWWLDEFKFRDARIDTLGIDRPGVDINPRHRHQEANLDDPMANFGRFDVALCLEVAEHLEKPGFTFVQELTSIAEIVVFSAAIPGQGGWNHANEQWQSWWVKMFERLGSRCDDWLRWAVWDDHEVETWYRQNMLVFIDGSIQDSSTCRFASHPFRGDVVHPDFYRQLLIDWQLVVDRCQGKCREWYGINWGGGS